MANDFADCIFFLDEVHFLRTRPGVHEVQPTVSGGYKVEERGPSQGITEGKSEEGEPPIGGGTSTGGRRRRQRRRRTIGVLEGETEDPEEGEARGNDEGFR